MNKNQHIITEREFGKNKLTDKSRAENCIFCGNEVIIRLTDKTYNKILNKGTTPIQRLGINLSATDREFFISGMCKNCQKDIFGY